MIVEVHGSLERAIKILKNRIGKDGLMGELQRREAYLSPSERRKVKDSIAQRRKQKHSRFKVWKNQEKKSVDIRGRYNGKQV